ncbi:MAG: hypothetical protein WCI03_01665 [bacterium]
MNPGLRAKLWNWRWPLGVTLITVIGLVIRLCMAWAMRYPACNGDFSVIGLMAKHMAEGTDYPVFAYGVAYMGSLEPGLAALLAKLLNIEVSAFIVNLSPALIGTLLLPLLYLFGREAGSRRAGLMAMLYCLVGSDTLLHNSVAPRGGYMNVMVGGLLALWLACRIASRESRGVPVSWRTYFWMGLAAGVAWWVTQLVVVFLMAAGVILLTGFRWRMVKVGLIPALIGTLLGSLPWWLWNIANQWGSLDFGGGMAKVPFSQGIVSFGHMFLRLLEMDPLASWRGAPRLIVLLGLMTCFIALLIRERIRAAQDDRFFFRLGALLLAVFMIAVYSTSGFSRVNTTRYLLPLFPAVAVMLAVACNWLLERFRLPWGWAAFILLIPPNILLLPKMFDGVPADRARWEMAAQLQKEVAPFCDGNFVGDHYTTHWLNFASREQLCVATYPLERYAPYARRVELAERRAYLNGYGNLGAFLLATKSADRQTVVGNMLVDYGLIPPSNKWHYVEPDTISTVRDHQGKDCGKVLIDSVMDSSWSTLLKSGSTGSLTFAFGRPTRLCGVRLFSLNNSYPWRVSIEGRQDKDSPWQSLMPPLGVTSYFWSGPYVMIDGVQYFQEFRFDSPEGGISEIRLTLFGPMEGEDFIKLGETLFMESDSMARGTVGEGWASTNTPATLVTRGVTALQKEGLKRFYAPRWLTERISAATSNTLSTLLPSLFTRSIHEMAGADSRDPFPLGFPVNTGLFMDSRDVPRSREVLRAAELTWREIQLGSITLLAVEADQQSHAGSMYSRVFWTEHGCFSANYSKEKSQLLYESAIRGTTSTNHQARLSALRQAVQTYPPHYPARQALVSALTAEGLVSEANTNDAVLKVTTQPAMPAAATFRNGVELLGVTVGDLAQRGQTLPIRYYWKCQSNVTPETWAVFVHFKKKGSLFQDDHVLLAEAPLETIRYQPFPEILVESRNVTIPQSATPGDYQIWIGLLDRQTGNRVTATSLLPNKKNAIDLPARLTILP